MPETIVIHNQHNLISLQNTVTFLLIAENSCNDMKDDLVISGYNCLRSIVVMKNAMRNLNSLKICDCGVLEEIIVENGEWMVKAPFENVKSVELTSK